MRVLELSPAPHEVALARVPPGMEVLVPGHPKVPSEERPHYVAVPGAALGWGAYACSYQTPAGITRYRHRRDRAVWKEAAQMLARAVQHDDSVAVLYLVCEQREEHGSTVWAAVRFREEEEYGQR